MPFNGVGTFTLVSGNPVTTGTVISSTVQNNTMSDFATGLSTCLTKDGQQTVTANIPMNSFKFTGLAAGTLAGDSLMFGQALNGSSLTLTGGISGATTGSFSGALTTAGITDSGTIAGTTGSFSSQLTAPTQSAGDSSTKVATTAFVAAVSFSTNLPGQTGKGGYVISTDGTNAAWANNFCYNDPSFGMTF